jgi:putative membrane protein
MFALMIVGMLLGIVLLVVLIWALVRLLNGLGSSQPRQVLPTPGGQSAEDILRERYARGEIDAATFEAMLARLRGLGAGGSGEKT